SGTLTFPPTQNIKEISIAVNGRALAERDNTFFVNLSSSANAITGKAQGVGSIHDPDFPPVIPGNQFAFVEFPTGTQFQVSLISQAIGMNASGQFVIAFVVPLADNGLPCPVVSWSALHLGGVGGTNIYAQGFDSSGAAVGSQFRVNTFITGGNRFTPSVAASPFEFVIAWAGSGPDDREGIFARRFFGNGVPLGHQFRFNGYTDNFQEHPAVGMDAAENVIVEWEGEGTGGDRASVS